MVLAEMSRFVTNYSLNHSIITSNIVLKEKTLVNTHNPSHGSRGMVMSLQGDIFDEYSFKGHNYWSKEHNSSFNGHILILKGCAQKKVNAMERCVQLEARERDAHGWYMIEATTIVSERGHKDRRRGITTKGQSSEYN